MKHLSKYLLNSILFVFISFSYTADTYEDKQEDSVTPYAVTWQSITDNFTYSGFNTYYSCSGLENQVERVLTSLGAKAIKVRAVGCVSGNIERIIPLRVSFEVLTKLDVDQVNANNSDTTNNLLADYQLIDFTKLNKKKTNRRGESQCELIRAISQSSLMSHFDYIEHKKMRICSPGYSSLNEINWSISTLKAL